MVSSNWTASHCFPQRQWNGAHSVNSGLHLLSRKTESVGPAVLTSKPFPTDMQTADAAHSPLRSLTPPFCFYTKNIAHWVPYSPDISDLLIHICECMRGSKQPCLGGVKRLNGRRKTHLRFQLMGDLTELPSSKAQNSASLGVLVSFWLLYFRYSKMIIG